MSSTKKKIRVVIRNMDDVIDFQILRWKRKYPDAKEPDAWSPNEIKPNEKFDSSQEISEEAVEVIRADDMLRTASLNESGIKTRGMYAKGFGASHDDAFVARAEADHKSHYEDALVAAAADLEREFGDEYEIVYEGEYAKRLMAAGEEAEKSSQRKKH